VVFQGLQKISRCSEILVHQSTAGRKWTYGVQKDNLVYKGCGTVVVLWVSLFLPPPLFPLQHTFLGEISQRVMAEATQRTLVDTTTSSSSSSTSAAPGTTATGPPATGVAARTAAEEARLERERVAHDLEQRIGSRPDMSDLADHGILRFMPSKAGGSRVAPTLQATSEHLRRELAQDGLEQRLQRRPDIERLRAENILRAGSSVAPSLQAASESVRKELLVQRVEHMIDRRRDAEDIRQRTTILDADCSDSGGIGGGGGGGSSATATAADALRHKIDQRPAKIDLIRQRILNPSPPPE